MERNSNPHYVTRHRELTADLDTPVSVYLRVKGQGPAFMLESVTGGEQVARYSFIGVNPGQIYILRGRHLDISENGKTRSQEVPEGAHPLDFIRSTLAPFQALPAVYGLPRFIGGLVGYISYDMVRFMETTVAQPPHSELPDAVFFHADSLIAFDHAFDRLILIATGKDESAVEKRLDALESVLSSPVPQRAQRPSGNENPALQSNQSKEEFIAAVARIKEHIAAGDIFQGVYSQRLSRETHAEPFDIYRALRRLNPSPYMFFFDFGRLAGTDQDFYLIGASPEMHVRLEGRTAALRPIAGTRPRGASAAEDQALESDLLGDPKERAEHLMLIDLARNDLGRVCTYGSVHVPEQFVVERYSHVMHIVSHTEGQLRGNADALDLIAATFPAGTVSGAPKVRAMQIIGELEPEPRGPYAGAVGYFGYGGNADTCIALRTLVMHGRHIHIQAGAGIVADSDPEMEYEETLNKARALAEAVAMAERPTAGGRIYDPGD